MTNTKHTKKQYDKFSEEYHQHLLNKEKKSLIIAFIEGILFLMLILLSNKFFYKLNQNILPQAKILSGILGALCLTGAIYIFIKYFKKLK